MQSLPFSIQANSGERLTDQIVKGLQQAIRSGYYKNEERLPSIVEMSRTLGVSDKMVQNAVKRLAQDGLVRTRRSLGIMVNQEKVHVWRGHILFLYKDLMTSYYLAMRFESLQQRLHQENIRITYCPLSADEIAQQYPTVKTNLAAQSFNLAILNGRAAGIDLLLAEKDIPFIHIDSCQQASNLARTVVAYDATQARQDFVQHCLKCGIKSILMLPNCDEELRALLVAHQIKVQWRDARCNKTQSEEIQRNGYDKTRAILASGQKLPGLLFLTDDIFACGALHALTEAGVRIPAELQVASHSNRGNRPFFPKDLTRWENDPKAEGILLSAHIIKIFSHPQKRTEPLHFHTRFIVGETTRTKS